MATMTHDLRRTDERGQHVQESPYFTSSAEVVAVDHGADASTSFILLHSFPTTGKHLIMGMFLNITEAFVGGTITIDVGQGSIATDDVTAGGTLTEVDADEYIGNALVTEGTIGVDTPSATTALYVAQVDGLATMTSRTATTGNCIVGAAATVPCIYVTLISDGIFTAGKCRLHTLLLSIPNT